MEENSKNSKSVPDTSNAMCRKYCRNAFFPETHTTGLLASWRHQIPGELKGKKIKA